MKVNESSYSSHPNLLTVDFVPDITMMVWMGINDSLQEYATYDPLGPTKPGFLNMVCVAQIFINSNKNLKCLAAKT